MGKKLRMKLKERKGNMKVNPSSLMNSNRISIILTIDRILFVLYGIDIHHRFNKKKIDFPFLPFPVQCFCQFQHIAQCSTTIDLCSVLLRRSIK